MKTTIILILNCLLAFNLNAQERTIQFDSVEVIPGFNNLYRYQNFYLSGQPTLEALRWLKAQGVNKIINLRTEAENNEYKNLAYDEGAIAQELGFEYNSLPIDGTIDYTPQKLNAFLQLIDGDEKILIHCTSAGRVTNFFMAYLIKIKGYNINETVEIGKDLKFAFPLEGLLNDEISMEIMN